MDIGTIRPNRRSAMMRVGEVQTLLPSCLRESHVAITRLRVDYPSHGATEPFELENAHILSVQFTRCEYSYTEPGHASIRLAWPRRTVAILDLRTPWRIEMHTPFDLLHFHITRAALNYVAEQMEAKPIRQLHCHPAAGKRDAVLYGLAIALLPGVEHPYEESRLFVDYTRFVVGAHVARHYGGMTVLAPARRGGLAPWQTRRATDMIDANLAGDMTVEQLARECEISVGHFVRAFRKTTGVTPHQWLTRRRLDHGKGLLKTTAHPISEVAVHCGFADQSHFTRVFSKHIGMTPAVWRRQYAVSRAESAGQR